MQSKRMNLSSILKKKQLIKSLQLFMLKYFFFHIINQMHRNQMPFFTLRLNYRDKHFSLIRSHVKHIYNGKKNLRNMDEKYKI